VGGRFRERLAALQQQLAAEADVSWLVIQGRALDLTRLSLPVPGTP
jgi:adenosylcobinamide kinase/adenosylcobinamide-phosphate guanylyltransferase